MKNQVTIDSSVIIASVLKFESKYQEAFQIMEKVLKGDLLAILQYSVLVEITGAIKRRTNSEKTANSIKNRLMNCIYINFIELNKSRAEEACKISSKFGLRGMDSLLAQVSEEFKTELITYDLDINKKFIQKLQ